MATLVYCGVFAEEERKAMDRQISVVKEVAAASRQIWKRVWDAILPEGPEETEPEDLVPEEIDPIESRTASAAHRFAQRLQRMEIVSSAKTGSRGSVISPEELSRRWGIGL
jgi:hypothetical protein